MTNDDRCNRCRTALSDNEAGLCTPCIKEIDTGERR